MKHIPIFFFIYTARKKTLSFHMDHTPEEVHRKDWLKCDTDDIKVIKKSFNKPIHRKKKKKKKEKCWWLFLELQIMKYIFIVSIVENISFAYTSKNMCSLGRDICFNLIRYIKLERQMKLNMYSYKKITLIFILINFYRFY